MTAAFKVSASELSELGSSKTIYLLVSSAPSWTSHQLLEKPFVLTALLQDGLPSQQHKMTREGRDRGPKQQEVRDRLSIPDTAASWL